MNCIEFEEELNHRLGRGTHAAAQEFSDHAAHCAACRALCEEMRTLDEAIAAWRTQVPEVDLVAPVLAAFTMNRQPVENIGPKSRRRLMAVIAGLAAMIAIGVALQFARPSREAVKPQAADIVVHNHPPVPQADPQTAPAAEIQGLVRSAGTAYLAIAEDAAGALGDAAILVLPAGPYPTNLNLNGTAAPADAAWTGSLETGLKPIGDSVGAAFNFLWKPGETQDGSKT